MVTPSTLGERVREARELAGASQADLAAAADVSTSTVSRTEHDSDAVSAEAIARVVWAVGLDRSEAVELVSGTFDDGVAKAMLDTLDELADHPRPSLRHAAARAREDRVDQSRDALLFMAPGSGKTGLHISIAMNVMTWDGRPVADDQAQVAKAEIVELLNRAVSRERDDWLLSARSELEGLLEEMEARADSTDGRPTGGARAGRGQRARGQSRD